MGPLRLYPVSDIDDASHFTELPLHLRGEIVEKFAGTLFRSSHVFNRLPEKVGAGAVCAWAQQSDAKRA